MSSSKKSLGGEAYDPWSYKTLVERVDDAIRIIRDLKSNADDYKDVFDRHANELKEVRDKLLEEPPAPTAIPIPDEPLYGLIRMNTFDSANENKLFKAPYNVHLFTDLDEARNLEKAAITQANAIPGLNKHHPTLYKIVLEPLM
jgi:hypothetical protein